MKDNYAKLLLELEKRTNGISGNQLADSLGVSTRSIRNYVKDLNNNYLQGARIEASPEHGYVIKGQITSITETGQLEFEQRAFFILRYLMMRTDITTYENLAEKLHYSSQTIRSDIYRIQELIAEEQRNVRLQAIIFKGVMLEGDELAIRSLLDSFFNPNTTSFEQLEREYDFYFQEWIDPLEIHSLIVCLRQQFVKRNLKPTPALVKPIANYIIIANYRDDLGQRLNQVLPGTQQLSVDTMDYASILLERGFQIIGDTIPDKVETWCFAWLLVSQQLLTDENAIGGSSESDSRLLNTIKKALLDLSNTYNQPFLQDTKLQTDLLLHISRDIYPLEYQFYIENSYLHHIKTDYIMAYQYAVDFAHSLIEMMNLKVPDNEIGYYALHFAAFLERNQQRTIDVAVIYARRPVTGQMLAQRIEEQFSNVQVVAIVDTKHIKDIPQVALLIASNESSIKSKYPIIYVNDWLDKQDNKKLQLQINQIILQQVLNGSLLIHGKFKNKNELIKTVLKKMGNDSLYSAIIQRERLSSTETGNFAAIPHPMRIPDVSKFSLGIVILDEPMKWSKELARLVIVVIPTHDQLSRYELVFKELQRVVTNNELPDLLPSIRTLDDFINLVATANQR
ncbi:BglG family transcription antiterminator [Companilactobacillus nuruki]|uniref:Uncharacterized protein n=1 Tax=Companilactobacillus nuruki TaxID=1993540 RepID=A0A2N7ARH3_9LACO|nr:HTH domain-containing protein [Companilactobacillus nuruki]PMD67953.1 hypothetical protein CBP76_11960 [Companilactobacillus nuruki]